jgi:hypothetical protein
MKTGHDALGIDENESGSVKHEKGTQRPQYRLKTSPGVQNMKKGPNALGTIENESRSAKHENGTRRPL